ncbi:hypothetical protein M434DRAFT_394376 [Hypoxylon sp. CO27-5]|nr:hypothetical protein M434DRAFT_394376 [Hypoxylon sp. CO27-5]
MAAFTFGVELEAAYFYTTKPGKAGIISSRHEELAPVIDMSLDAIQRRNPDFASERFRVDEYMLLELERYVAEVVQDFVNALPETSRGEVIPLTKDPILNQYRQWRVGHDNTIMLDFSRSYTYTTLRWAPLEVQSPAMYATEGAFKEVEAVTDMLRTSFRTTVNPSCGLHVHIGWGPKLFPLEMLKKMAAIVWAGDCLFQQMHPVSRRHNRYCQGPRTDSLLEKGHKAAKYNPPSKGVPRSVA